MAGNQQHKHIVNYVQKNSAGAFLTNTTQQSSSEAISCSDTQEFLHILWNPKVPCPQEAARSLSPKDFYKLNSLGF
jgi:hypothetical protein